MDRKAAAKELDQRASRNSQETSKIAENVHPS
jgi:hypothetical protein